jgi:hypothetical protein
MRIFEGAKPAVVICTRDRDRATAFYRDGRRSVYCTDFGFLSGWAVILRNAESRRAPVCPN